MTPERQLKNIEQREHRQSMNTALFNYFLREGPLPPNYDYSKFLAEPEKNTHALDWMFGKHKGEVIALYERKNGK